MVNKLKLNRVGSQQAEITEITGERQVGGPWRKAMPLNADLRITGKTKIAVICYAMLINHDCF